MKNDFGSARKQGFGRKNRGGESERRSWSGDYDNKSFKSANATSPERAEAYALLGLQVGAGRREILKAYHTAIKKYHPDHGGATEQAAALNAARDLLLKRG